MATPNLRVLGGPRRRPKLLWPLVVLLVLQGVGAVAGGAAFVAKPSGDVLHMSGTIDPSPFPDFLIPGLILLVVLGIVPLVAAVGVYRGRPWAWFVSFAIGCALVIFEIVEVAIIGFNVLQPIYGVVGLLIALLTIAPAVQHYCGLRWGRRLASREAGGALGR